MTVTVLVPPLSFVYHKGCPTRRYTVHNFMLLFLYICYCRRRFRQVTPILTSTLKVPSLNIGRSTGYFTDVYGFLQSSLAHVEIVVQNRTQVLPTILLLLLLSLSSSSSSSPSCRVFILIFLRQTMSLGNTVLQLFCCYYAWCLYRQSKC